jgi:hypothetical protein
MISTIGDALEVSYGRHPITNIESRDEQFIVHQDNPVNQAVQDVPRPNTARPQLKPSDPDDSYEQEAERVADRITHKPAPVEQQDIDNTRGTGLPESAPGNFMQLSPEIESGIQMMAGSGRPLPEPVKSYYESRFDDNFSKVRIHTDARSAESAQAIEAQAYTIGSHLVFGEGQYEPHTEQGRRLLAHELVHVVQQSSMAPILAIADVNQGDLPEKDTTGLLTLKKGYYFFDLGNEFWHLIRPKEVLAGAEVALNKEVPVAGKWKVGWVFNLLSQRINASWSSGKPLNWKLKGTPYLDQIPSMKGKGPWYSPDAVTLLAGEGQRTVYASDTPQVKFAHYRAKDQAKGELKSFSINWRFAAWLLGHREGSSLGEWSNYVTLYAVVYSFNCKLTVAEGIKWQKKGSLFFEKPIVDISSSPLNRHGLKGLPKVPALSGMTANEASNAQYPKDLLP